MNKFLKNKINTKDLLQKTICFISYFSVFVFFLTLYLMMFMSYEDILQKNTHLDSSLSRIIADTINYLPRIGEVYQRIAVHYMTIKTSVGPDLVFRIINALMSWFLIYLGTYFVLKRRPIFKYKDAGLFMILSIILIISPFNDIFIHEFAFANNYAISTIFMLLFALVFRLDLKLRNNIQFVSVLLIGIFLGLSSEIMAILSLFIIMLFFCYELFVKKSQIRALLLEKKHYFIVVLGLILGLIIFYLLGNGLGARVSGSYAKAYGYLPIKTVITNPLNFISGFKDRLWYNIRYLDFFILFPSLSILSYTGRFRNKIILSSFIKWNIAIQLFSLMYVLLSSLIFVHDDLYPRLMFIVFFGIIISFLIYLESHTSKDKIIGILNYKKLALASITILIVAIADVYIGYNRYHKKVEQDLNKIEFNQGQDLIIKPISSDGDQAPSPLFKFKQQPPFHWGFSKNYLKYGYSKYKD